MSTLDRADSTTPSRAMTSRVREAIGDSTLLKLGGFGALEFFLAFVIDVALQNDIIGRDAGLNGFLADLFQDGGLWGLWAAVLGVWGTGLMLAGFLGYAFVWFQRR